MSTDVFSVSNKSATSKKVVVQQGETENDNDNNNNNNMVMLHHHHQHQHHDENHHRPSPSYVVGDGNGKGPTCYSKSRSSGCDIYNVIGGVAGAFDTSSSSGGLRALQPFDIGVPADTATRTTQNTFKSPGDMAASMGFPFTNAQWKELERQAMIYKYMMASVPVPPDLLFPIIRNPSLSAVPSGSGLNLLRFSSGGDPEPGRCKRTDGKKWRCSRDVAPDQKYCERHLHRGRPRSRKPVELPPPNNKKKTRLEPHPHSLPPPISNPINNTANLFTSPSHYAGTIPQTFFSPIESLKEHRCLDWTMRGEPIQMSSSSSHEWHHLIQQTGMGLPTESSFSNTSCNSSVLNLHYGEDSLNLNSYSNFSGSEEQQSTEFPFFINPDLVALEKQHQGDPPRGFIDAWSNGVSDDEQNAHSKSCSVSSNGNLPLSPLSLSMGGNNRFGEEMGQVQRSLIASESGQDNECSTSWLNPVAWPGSTPGGPLAEVLRPSTVTSASDPPSPAAENGDPGSPPTTRFSSPSGVLQKTLASFSDSSGNSSPTLASSRANKPPQVALLWSNQEKI